MRSYSFGPYIFIPERQSLVKNERPVRLGSRAVEILAALVERPGELLSKDELVSRAWPETFVEESNLKVTVAALRRALGDAPADIGYIATVSGRGYRFVSPVHAAWEGEKQLPAPVAPARAHNLPVTTTRLVGRGDAVNATLDALFRSRLVTIVGPGGIGKTRLALAAAEALAGACQHGIWFVDLARVSDAALVPTSIASALGLRVHSARIEAALAAFAADRELMLILDNCEHVIEAAAACAGMLLAAAPRLRIIATSREPLRIGEEQLYRLPPLESPPQDAALSAAEALAFPAVELFVERAAKSFPGFELDDADAPVVAEICRRLDGLALAIELAAPRLDAFSARELLDLLADQSQLCNMRSGPDRHHTLAATLDWSYGLLAEPERMLLRRLSVFAGAFSLESACAIAADKGNPRAQCTQGVANLVAKSLVAIERGELGTQYRLLDTTRRYALERLEESGEREALRQRHAEHLLVLAERAETEWKIRPTDQWLAEYGSKVDDIRLALGWAFSTANRSLALGVALTVAAIPFWEHLSLVEECRARLEAALETSLADTRSLRDEMKLHLALGTALFHTRGPVPEVKAAWATALGCAETLGDIEFQMSCLWGLCDYATWTGDHRTTLATAEKIRKLADTSGDPAARTNVERQTGTALRYLGELGKARRHFERMIAHYVPPVTRSDIARFQLDPRSAARGTLANVLWLQGHPQKAVAMAERQLEEARAARHALALCNALIHTTCPIALWTGDLDGAERMLATIEVHMAEHAMTIWMAMGRCLRADCLLQSGDARGLALMRGALEELDDVGFRMRCPFYTGIYAAGLGAFGDPASGLAAIEPAIALSASTGELWCMPELLRIKADLLRRDNGARTVQARDALYLQALDLAHRQGARSWELRTATTLAEDWFWQGHGARASDLLTPIYRRFSDGFETADLVRARLILDALPVGGDGRRGAGPLHPGLSHTDTLQ